MTENTRSTRRLLGYLISAAAVIVLASFVDWNELLAAFFRADLASLALALLLLFVCYYIFAFRWRSLLIYRSNLPLRPVFAILMAGYVTNLLFPLRPGDLLRVLLIDRRFDYGKVRGLTSVALERFLDLATLGLYGVLVILALPSGMLPGLDQALGVTFVLLIGAGSIVGLSILIGDQRIATAISSPAWAARLRPRLSAAIAELRRALRDFLMDSPGASQRLITVSLLSLLGWGLFGAAMMACISAMAANVSWFAAIALMVTTNLGGAIPSSPAGIGVYHALAVMTLAAFGIEMADALAIAIISHGLVVLSQAGLGLATLALGDRATGPGGWALLHEARTRQGQQ